MHDTRLRPLPLLVLAAAVALGGCSISPDEEVEIGRENAEKIEQQVPLVRDRAVTAYLDSVGQRIAREADSRNLTWTFSLVNDTTINAFALPGGFIYVNRGLIEQAETLSELTGVLGHEIGHVTQRHSAKQMEKAQRTNGIVILLCAVTSLCDSRAGATVVQIGGGALMAKFSRGDELEADSVAVDYVVKAGYDPDGIANMFTRMMELRGRDPGALDAWFGTHPVEEDRVQQARRLVRAREGALSDDLVTDDELYQAFRARVKALPIPDRPSRLGEEP